MIGDVFQPGEMCGQWEILGLLGRGGFAEVYLARGPKNELRALKCLRLKHRANKDMQTRLGNEARLLSHIENVHVVKFFDAGIEDLGKNRGEIIWVALEYIEGKTLRDHRYELQNQLPIEDVLRWFSQVANGLAVAHQIRIVHRDLKPENIMIDLGGIAHIVDFGIAKLQGWGVKATTKGKNLGTASYISPEQVDDPKRVDGRSDIYSLGIALYECLAKRHPFGGVDDNDEPTAGEMVARQIAQQAVPLARRIPGFPEDVSVIVERMMEKDPARRFQTMKELEHALNAALKRQMDETRAAALRLNVTGESSPFAPPTQVTMGSVPLDPADQLGPTGPMSANLGSGARRVGPDRAARPPSSEEPVSSRRPHQPRWLITESLDTAPPNASRGVPSAGPERDHRPGWLITEPIGAPRLPAPPAPVARPRPAVTEPLPGRPEGGWRGPIRPVDDAPAQVQVAPIDVAPAPMHIAPIDDPARASRSAMSPVSLVARHETTPLQVQLRRGLHRTGAQLVNVLGHRVALMIVGVLCGALGAYATASAMGLIGNSPPWAAMPIPSVVPAPSASHDAGAAAAVTTFVDAPRQEPEPVPAAGGSATAPSASATGSIAPPPPKPRSAAPPPQPRPHYTTPFPPQGRPPGRSKRPPHPDEIF